MSNFASVSATIIHLFRICSTLVIQAMSASISKILYEKTCKRPFTLSSMNRQQIVRMFIRYIYFKFSLVNNTVLSFSFVVIYREESNLTDFFFFGTYELTVIFLCNSNNDEYACDVCNTPRLVFEERVFKKLSNNGQFPRKLIFKITISIFSSNWIMNGLKNFWLLTKMYNKLIIYDSIERILCWICSKSNPTEVNQTNFCFLSILLWLNVFSYQTSFNVDF